MNYIISYERKFQGSNMLEIIEQVLSSCDTVLKDEKFSHLFSNLQIENLAEKVIYDEFIGNLQKKDGSLHISFSDIYSVETKVVFINENKRKEKYKFVFFAEPYEYKHYFSVKIFCSREIYPSTYSDMKTIPFDSKSVNSGLIPKEVFNFLEYILLNSRKKIEGLRGLCL